MWAKGENFLGSGVCTLSWHAHLYACDCLEHLSKQTEKQAEKMSRATYRLEALSLRAFI